MKRKTKRLPVGIQNFEEIIAENYVYVDKTEHIYQLIEAGKVYFLSRPRRFGKSLTLSTLECIFQGKRHLFKGLKIDSLLEKWEPFPIIRLSMNDFPNHNLADLKKSIQNTIHEISKKHNVPFNADMDVETQFSSLIKEIGAQKPVVILIDEYDKPLINHLEKTEYAKTIRDFLKSFYGKLKANDAFIKFLFITGVSKFSRAGIFSDLNHLNDLTMSEKAHALTGCTQEELEHYFSEEINELAKKYNISTSELLVLLKQWYNGYRFSEEIETLYNPFSILKCFYDQKITNYWFETGTPTFLINLLKKNQYPKIENLKKAPATFSTYDIDNLNIYALLVQTGYLTIKGVEGFPPRMHYYLDFPNEEVRSSLMQVILEDQVKRPGDALNITDLFINSILENDLDELIHQLKSFFASIPYDILDAAIPREKYYQSLIFTIFSLMSLRPIPEDRTNIGRVDLSVETDKHIYLFEFKMNLPATEALQQIKDNKYPQKFSYLNKPIILVGISFDTVSRNISDWVHEQQR